jgi:hypothetical protein
MFFCLKKLATNRENDMPKKSAPMTAIPDGFSLTEKTIKFVSERYPTVSIEGTLDKFVESSLAHGRMYADWQAAFRIWVRKSVENKWDGCEFKKGRSQDPKWIPILSEAAPYGFRAPLERETPEVYRTQFNWWKDEQKHKAPVIEFGESLRGFGK